jgi:hypothetical protein
MRKRKTRGQAHEERAGVWARRVLANSGAGAESFTEPQGWALKWDGETFTENGEVEGVETTPRAQDDL